MFYSQWKGQFSLESGDLGNIPQVGDTLRGGGAWHRRISNYTDLPILLKSGYDTVANGRAQDIVCPPRATIQKITLGSARDFAVYKILPLQGTEKSLYEIDFNGIHK